MSILLELIIYFLIFLGFITIFITIFEKIQYIEPLIYRENSNYYKEKSNGSATLVLRLKDINEDTKNKIITAINLGNYADIYNVIDSFVVEDT